MASGDVGAATDAMRAVEGDIVTLHWNCLNENGEILESSRVSDEPTSFEVGAGNIVGNRLFEGFDEAVRGMALGETATLRVCRFVCVCIHYVCELSNSIICAF